MEVSNNFYKITNEYNNSPPFHSILYKLDDINSMLKTLSEGWNAVQSKRNDLENRWNEIIQNKEWDEQEIFQQNTYEPEDEGIKSTEKSLITSSILKIYSVVELTLKRIEEVCEKKFNVKKPKSNTKNMQSKIGKSLNYIKNSSKCSFEDLDQMWTEIDNFRLVRNCISHNDGFFGRGEDLYYKRPIKELEIFEFKKPNGKTKKCQLLPSKRYVEYISKLSIEFSEKLMKKIWDTHYVAK